ncbi:SWIM zinc finger family protein [Erysipelothrix anatis]|uniref:SWIM zinc finger family protein n=1 Tax=Erysipelothrix anatis TaxID=2683713 RepID=UPI00135A0F75|nr:hypothetical protein [Erysipelothrix anatis]
MEVGFYFRDYIYNRGETLLEESKVQIIEDTKEVIRARVQGSDLYIVRIEITGNAVDSMYCSCEHAKKGNNCKHMAATIASSIKNGNIHNFSVEALETFDDYASDLDMQDGTLTPELMVEVGHLLSLLSHDNLIEYLIVLFERYPQLAQQFSEFDFTFDGQGEDLS